MTDQYLTDLLEMIYASPEFKATYIDVEPLPGEEYGDAGMRYLEELGILRVEGDYVFIDREKAIEFDPNLLACFDALHMAEISASMRNLEELGLVESGIDEAGEIVYWLTDSGTDIAGAIVDNS